MNAKISETFLKVWPDAIAFSTGHGSTNKYLGQRLSSSDFIKHVSSHCLGPKAGSAWSPFRFRNGIRRVENCLDADVIALDIDNGTALGKIRAGLAFSGCAAVITSTYSHTPIAPRFRIVVPLARTFRVSDYTDKKEAADVWKRLGLALANTLDLVTDLNALLLSQLFFDPRCQAGVEPVVKLIEGRALDAEKLLARAEADASDQLSPGLTEARLSPAKPHDGTAALNSFIRDGEIDYGALRSAAMTIKNDSRFDERLMWIKMCGALHHASEGTRDGLNIWLDWCARWTGGDDDEKENVRVWESMRKERSNGATAGTLIRLAIRDGWSPPAWLESPEFRDKRSNIKTSSGRSTPLPEDAGEHAEPNFNSRFPFTGAGGDIFNGKLYGELYRNRLLFIHETNEVLRFDDVGGWLVAAPGTAERAAKAVVQVLKDAATNEIQLRHVTRMCAASSQKAMIEMARSESGMTRRLSDFDKNSMMLGVANGVLDLGSGKLLSMSPSLLVSKRSQARYDPDATCPRFEEFLQQVQPDADVRAFLQRFAGYCLTGYVDEHVFAFFYGHGANGKSTFIELLAWLLGDYARKIETEMLMRHQRSPQGPSPDVLALRGLRLAYANETTEGCRLDESRVKELTGGDMLTARAPYGRDFVTFPPTHKLVIVGNHRPEIADTSFGMWRRVVMIPWSMTIAPEKRDPRLLGKLKREGAGVLNWALRGLLDVRAGGLQIPATIKSATNDYRDEQDIIGEWVSERCAIGPRLRERKLDLYADYQQWAEQNGHKPFAQARLTRRLNDRGFHLARDKRTVCGVSLKRLDENF